MSKPVLHVLICSTRPGRNGGAIADTIAALAREHGTYDVKLVDLAEFELPVFDEPHHPIMGMYEHAHTKRWSESVASADAFIFVMPEYNHSFNSALKNAIDYLHSEWRFKPVGLVSYGGGMGGVRAIGQLKPILAALKFLHAADVNISMQLTPVVDGTFEGNDIFRGSVAAMFGEIDRLLPASQMLRQ